MTDVTSVDVDRLPPTQYLILDVLAARWRLGERFWTFPARMKPWARDLEQVGLVSVDSSPAPGCVRAGLTDAGRSLVVTPGYQAPSLRDDRPSEPATARREEWASEHDFPTGVDRFETRTDRALAERRVAIWRGRGVTSRLLRQEITEHRGPWLPVEPICTEEAP